MKDFWKSVRNSWRASAHEYDPGTPPAERRKKREESFMSELKERLEKINDPTGK